MTMSQEEVWMLRLVNQATAQGFVVAQDYRTREVMLCASSGEVLVHHNVSALRRWLRPSGDCRRFGCQCVVNGRQVCLCVPAFPGVRRTGVRG